MPVLQIPNFSGGINQALPPHDIADSELADAENFLLNDQRQAAVRPGVTIISDDIDNTSCGTLTVPSPARADVVEIMHYDDGTNETVLVVSNHNSGAVIVSKMSVGGGTLDPCISDGVTMAGGKRWQCVNYRGMAICANRGTGSNVNPVKLDSPTDTSLSVLGGSPPKARYVWVWNDRVFLVDEEDPFTVHWSALGNAEDWTTTGKAGSGSHTVRYEGGPITGGIVFLDRVFLLQERWISMIVPGAPNTDTDQWQFPVYSRQVGGLSGFTAQEVLNDVLFLSQHGVVSLRAVEAYGDFEKAVLSRNIPSLRGLAPDGPYASGIDVARSHYFLAIPTSLSGATSNGEAWVLDFGALDQAGPAWMRVKDGVTAGEVGGIVGASYASVPESGTQRMYVGFRGKSTSAGESLVGRYADDGVWEDQLYPSGTVPYRKRLVTKSYDMGDPLIRKQFHKFAAQVRVLTDSVALETGYYLDGNAFVLKTFDDTLTRASSGLVWDEGDWGDDWGGVAEDTLDVMHFLRGTPGKRGDTVTFLFGSTAAEGFVIERVSTWFDALSERQVADV